MTLAPIEIATGIVFGVEPRRLPPPTATPAQALEAAVRPALQRGRVLVSFSGGRDSSAVLAVAAAVARREGLPDPVPVTIRASEVPQSHESEWQEAVVRHLGIADWVRLEIRDELDAVGPYARRAMARHGLLWPFNAHFHSPMLELVPGGTLLTGIGGDELWSSARSRTVRRRRHLLRLAPFPLRRAVLARKETLDFPWLRERGRRQAVRLSAAESATVPWTATRRLAWSRGMRYTATGTAALDRLAADAGAAIAHPLLDLGLWAAMAATAPPAGFRERDAALAAVAGHVLPADVVSRRTKAGFDALFFADHARALTREEPVEGIPADLVDVEALHDHWRGAAPDPHSLTLLQASWLASGADRVEQPASRGRE